MPSRDPLKSGRNSGPDEDLGREFEDIKSEALALIDGLNESQLTSKPAVNRWSIPECLDHLIVTGRHCISLHFVIFIVGTFVAIFAFFS